MGFTTHHSNKLSLESCRLLASLVYNEKGLGFQILTIYVFSSCVHSMDIVIGKR